MSVKARDLRDNIQMYGFEKGIVATLELLLDEHAELRQHMKEAADLIGQLVEATDRLNVINGGITRILDMMQRDREGGEQYVKPVDC